MTGTSFVLRGLRYFRGSYAGVLAGSALGAMVLLGAMMAGDSVKGTLRGLAEARIGGAQSVLVGGDRLFRSALADDLGATGIGAAPVMVARGAVSDQGSGRAAGGVQVLGVDERFWEFAPGGGDGVVAPAGSEFLVNRQLAAALDLEVGSRVVLRMDKPGALPLDAPMVGQAEELVVMRGTVRGILGDGEFGRFGLETNQLPPLSLFVSLGRLQRELEIEGRANLMLLGEGAEAEKLEPRLTLEDYGLEVVDVPLAKASEVRSKRVFFDRRAADAISGALPEVQPVITYLANTIAGGGKETPYSMVTAVGPEAAPFLPEAGDGVVINEWQAEDLGVGAGDELRIDYYAVEGGSRLVERSASFQVAAVVPLEGLAGDRLWMPEFPGVSDAEDAADWNPALPLDMKRIRDKDEVYWDDHRGTPKVFLPLEKGREMFGNRWGEFTALRVPLAVASREEIGKRVLAAMDPETGGLMLRNLREEGMAAASSPVDFAGLFGGMSFFLMIAAVALTAMLFRFHIEQRNRESGLLAAVGVPANKMLRWRLAEGLCVVAAGSVVGAVLAVIYTRGLLRMLDSIWGVEGGERLFRFYVSPVTLVGGVAGFIVLVMVVIWLTVRRQAKRSASLRLEAGSEEVARKKAGALPWWAIGFGVAAAGALAGAAKIGPQGAFFMAGFALLLAGLATYRWVLRRQAGGGGGELDPRRLAVLNSGRRAMRSAVVVGSLACGVFLVVAVAAFRKDTGGEWQDRASGTGGFAFWIETSSSINRGSERSMEDDPLDLGDDAGRFDPVVPMRVGAGADASCFNLNAVARPRMLACDVSKLGELGAFSIKKVREGCDADWGTLRHGEVMRGFVDESTLMWVLKKKLGDRILYQDEWGRKFPVELVGALNDTVLQGHVVVDERRFLERYPGSEGYRLFLTGSGTEVGEGMAFLQRSLADRGAVVETTAGRLAAFHGVENTYIAIFHLLGGLGVVLGSAGLGVVTARNLAERKFEFAMLHTLGVPAQVSRGVVWHEVVRFIAWGLGIGLVAAIVAILPGISGAGGIGSFGWVAVLVVVIAANAWFWSWLGWRRVWREVEGARRELG